MATSKTDLESAAADYDKLAKEVEKLREQAEVEERKLIEKQQLDSVKTNTEVLEAEKARLQARLEAAKEAAKAYSDTRTPLELAAAAQADADAAADPNKKKEA